MAAILAPAVLFPCGPNGRIRTIQHSDVHADTHLACQLPDNLACRSRGPSPLRPAPGSPQGLQSNMRLIARFVVLMVAVFGVSLAFAWAWDKSDKPHDATTTAHAAT